MNRTFVNTKAPEWGTGLEVQQFPNLSVLFFEKAGEKKFVIEKALANGTLAPATVTPAVLAALQARASGRRPRSIGLSTAQKRAARPSAKKGAKSLFATFKDQLVVFEKLFAGGFAGEAYTTSERTSKDAAIEKAKTTLSAEAFAAESVDELFTRAQAVLAATNIVFPIEGNIPFKKLEGDARAQVVAGLKELLHGAAPAGERVERFAASLHLKDKDGKEKKVTWPLATVFAALFAPAEFVAVKPTAFALQGGTLNLSVERSEPVGALGYGKFLEVAQKTRDLLVEAGQQPRDLLDVYTFIWKTHAEKPAA